MTCCSFTFSFIFDFYFINFYAWYGMFSNYPPLANYVFAVDFIYWFLLISISNAFNNYMSLCCLVYFGKYSLCNSHNTFHGLENSTEQRKFGSIFIDFHKYWNYFLITHRVYTKKKSWRLVKWKTNPNFIETKISA